MTNPAVYAQAVIVADRLLAAGEPVIGFDGLDNGLIQLTLSPPGQLPIYVTFAPGTARDKIQGLLREALAPRIERSNRNGFDRTGATEAGLPGDVDV